MRVLLIEDEKNISSFISKGLEAEGYVVTAVYDGESGLIQLTENQFDLVILDIVLPRMNGWDVCRHIRTELRNDLPILMLTALTHTDQVVKGLDAGADDYLGKPFKMTELLARLNALRRRYSGLMSMPNTLSYADLRMNLATKEVWRGNQPLQLTVKEYNLLKLFLSQPKKVFSRVQILEQVWGVAFDTGTNVVDVYVNYLRKKIDKDFEPKLLHTVFGMGYTLRAHDSEE